MNTVPTTARRPLAAAHEDVDDYEALQNRRKASRRQIGGFPDLPDLARLSGVELLRVGTVYHAAHTDEQRFHDDPRTPDAQRQAAVVTVFHYAEGWRKAAELWARRERLRRRSPQQLRELAAAFQGEAEHWRGLRGSARARTNVDLESIIEQRSDEAEFRLAVVTQLLQ